jgi:hypothetical protein
MSDCTYADLSEFQSTYKDLFDIQYIEEQTILKLTYATGRAPFNVALKALSTIGGDLKLAWFCELEKYRTEIGYEEENDYIECKNLTLLTNFAESMGWTREQFIDRSMYIKPH